jgi:hypothetical protein
VASEHHERQTKHPWVGSLPPGDRSALRIEHELGPPPDSLIALLKDLETRVLDAEREKAFAEVDARVTELLRAVGRQPIGA